MLVLTRKPNQRVIIGQTVEVVVLEMHGNTVKLGFSGPPDVSIHREEVLQRIKGIGSCRQLHTSGSCGSSAVPIG